MDQASEEELSGASVLLEHTAFGMITDIDGKFSFTGVPAGNYTLKVSFAGSMLHSQQIDLKSDQSLQVIIDPTITLGEGVIVAATRVDENAPVAYTNINKQELESRNLGQDMPFLLNMTPSVVTTSDAGTGIGYTGMWIRGSDPTRVNITINRIPYNDACLLYTSPSPRDGLLSRMPSSA